jgi:hypothetical protein
MKQRLPIIVATVALVVAVLGSTQVGQAARNLVVPKGSVGTPQLKNGAVTAPKLRNGAVATPKLRNGAVTTLKVLNGSLLAEDFKPGQLPGGQKGDKGDPGPPGLSEVQVVSAASATNSSSSREVNVSCPAGKTLTGGGARLAVGPALSNFVALSKSAPAGNTWSAAAAEIVASNANWTLHAYAICGKTG